MRKSETVTENIFRDFYGAKTFIEKSAIPETKGFKSKNKTEKKGYPDFFKEEVDYDIIVEAKADSLSEAEADTLFYMENNTINKELIGIAVSGQDSSELKVSYFLKINNKITKTKTKNVLLSLYDLNKLFTKEKFGDTLSSKNLTAFLKSLNNKFHENKNMRVEERSLFFSGLMIALSNNNFRSLYKHVSAPTKEDISTTNTLVIEAHNLNKIIIESIKDKLKDKINNLSKEFNWVDRFSFIKTIDYPLEEYKKIIEGIEKNIFIPFQNEEKQDILGKAYKIFLSRAGKIDNKNIILTPDHIKGLMISLANLNVNDVVIDTCTGSGAFLMEAMEKLLFLANGDPEKIKEIKEKQLIGFEIDPVLFSLSCSNMFLHGDGNSNLLYRNSLLSKKDENDQRLLEYIKGLRPTKCIINPPYENSLSFKFTKQAMDYIEPNGKLIIIMPSNTLTKNLNETEELLSTAELDFILEMPDNLFKEQDRTISTSIFGFTKKPHDREKEVLFAMLKDDGFVSVQHKGKVDKHNKWKPIENKIINTIKNSKEIKGLSFKKNIFDEQNKLDFNKSLKVNDNYVKISELFNIEKGALASESNNPNGSIDFVTAGKTWKTHDTSTHNCEALVYATSASGSLGRSHYVNGTFIASNLCLVLTEKNKDKYPMNLEFYNYYFNTLKEDFIDQLSSGASKKVFRKKDFENYYINYIDLKTQNKLLKELKENNEKIIKLEKEKNSIINNSKNIIKDLD